MPTMQRATLFRFRVTFRYIPSHSVAVKESERAGSLPAAVSIVKERGGSPTEHLTASGESLFGG